MKRLFIFMVLAILISSFVSAQQSFFQVPDYVEEYVFEATPYLIFDNNPKPFYLSVLKGFILGGVPVAGTDSGLGIENRVLFDDRNGVRPVPGVRGFTPGLVIPE